MLATACSLSGFAKTESIKKTHLVTLSFDDGFKKSSIRTAEIFEKYELSACINVIATAHLPALNFPMSITIGQLVTLFCGMNCRPGVMRS